MATPTSIPAGFSFAGWKLEEDFNLIDMSNYKIIDGYLAFELGPMQYGKEYYLDSNIAFDGVKIGTSFSNISGSHESGGSMNGLFLTLNETEISQTETQYLFLRVDGSYVTSIDQLGAYNLTLTFDDYIDENTVVFVPHAHSLIADYTAVDSTLTIQPNGGSYNGSSSNQTVPNPYGTEFALSLPTRDNYLFTGWQIVSGNGSIDYYSNATLDSSMSIAVNSASFSNDRLMPYHASSTYSVVSDSTSKTGYAYRITTTLNGLNRAGFRYNYLVDAGERLLRDFRLFDLCGGYRVVGRDDFCRPQYQGIAFLARVGAHSVAAGRVGEIRYRLGLGEIYEWIWL